VVSGALRDEIALGLERLHVLELVPLIVSAEDTRACKPDPEGYVIGIAHLARQFGEPVARNALVIEDSLSGIEAAKAAGLACIAVSHSYPAAALRESNADLVVEALEELTEELIAALFRRLHA
jgi:sugar-phosphatase